MADNYEKQVLAAQCPACGARSGERCELNTGYERITPHLDRILTAESLALRLPERKAGSTSAVHGSIRIPMIKMASTMTSATRSPRSMCRPEGMRIERQRKRKLMNARSSPAQRTGIVQAGPVAPRMNNEARGGLSAISRI